MTGGREHQGSSCRGVGVVRLEPFDPSSGSGRGLLAESSNAEDVRPICNTGIYLAIYLYIKKFGAVYLATRPIGRCT